MITLESVVIAVLGAVLGVVLGICFGIAMMYAVRDEGLEVISLPWAQLAVFLAASVVVGRARGGVPVAARGPSRRAPRDRDRVDARGEPPHPSDIVQVGHVSTKL